MAASKGEFRDIFGIYLHFKCYEVNMPSKVIPVIIDNEIYNITIYDQYGNIRHTIFIFIF